MDILKKKRKTLQTQVTKLLSEAKELFQLTPAVINDLEILIQCISLSRDQLGHVDAAIEPLITERDMEMEFTQIVDYTDKIVTCLTRLRKKAKGVENSQRASGSSNDWRATAVKAKVKLPKLELIKFNGNRKNWQAFCE